MDQVNPGRYLSSGLMVDVLLETVFTAVVLYLQLHACLTQEQLNLALHAFLIPAQLLLYARIELRWRRLEKRMCQHVSYTSHVPCRGQHF